MSVEGELAVRVKVLGVWLRMKRKVRVEVEDLAVSADATFDWSDPTRPKIGAIGQPQVRFRVKLRTPGHPLTDVLLRALSPFATALGRDAAAIALLAVRPQLEGLRRSLPGPIPAEGAPLLADSGSTTPVSAIVAAVDSKIRAVHMPHGIIHPMRMDVPSTATWAQAFGPGGAGTPGQPTPHGDGGDSSAMNAHYVAAQAMRWALTKDPAALEAVRRCLVAYEDLLAVHGDTGLMARVAAPEASPMGRIIVSHNPPATIVRAVRRGEPWVGTNGDKGDSRDVFIEIVFGLAVVHDMVADPQVRADAARMIGSMVGYLVREGWIVDEDRAPVDFAQGAASTFPTFWLGVAPQKLAMLLTAARLDPARFSGELARWTPLARTAWLSQWTSTFGLDDYFGYVLAHVTYYTHLRQETDAQRYMEMSRAYRILRRYVGHHRNAYFDALHLALDPADTRYRGAVREALVRYVQRPHRKVAPATFDPAAIQVAPFTFPFGSYAPGSGGGAPLTVLLPVEPLSPELRAGEDDTIWQRSPFKAWAGPGQGDPYIESTGMDLVGPYWIGRYFGVVFP